jgi:hypothetical protein
MRPLRTLILYITNVYEESCGFEHCGVRFWGKIAFNDTCNKGDGVERVAYLLMIGILIMLITVVFAVLGKGEYRPPPPEEQGLAPQYVLL